VTYEQAASWLGSVEGWVSLARQARANPDFADDWVHQNAGDPTPRSWPASGRRSGNYVYVSGQLPMVGADLHIGVTHRRRGASSQPRPRCRRFW
jgi:hypothetical protein